MLGLHRSLWIKVKLLVVANSFVALLLLVPRGAAQIATPGGEASSTSQIPVPKAASRGNITAYDVSVIKPSDANGKSYSVNINGDTFSAQNVTLGMMLHYAYSIGEERIIGIPEKLYEDRFDIKAKILDPTPSGAPRLSGEQRRQMFANLLTTRFNLKLHWEKRRASVLELRVAKTGLKLGSASSEKTFHGVGTGGVSTGDTHLTAHGISMRSLVEELTQKIGRTVIDRTNINGLVDISMEWVPTGDDSGLSDKNFTDIRDALKSDAGLLLIEQKDLTDFLIIDSVAPSDHN